MGIMHTTSYYYMQCTVDVMWLATCQSLSSDFVSSDFVSSRTCRLWEGPIDRLAPAHLPM